VQIDGNLEIVFFRPIIHSCGPRNTTQVSAKRHQASEIKATNAFHKWFGSRKAIEGRNMVQPDGNFGNHVLFLA
jgi:hypothetical protein